MSTATWTVVLDDDPTGTQGLSDVPVIIQANDQTLEWASAQDDLTYLLSNTRAYSKENAARIVTEAVRNVAAHTHDREVRFISRGDSTLRGHFPLEVQIIRELDPKPLRGCLLVPAFPDAGRVTLEGVHHLRVNGELRPVSATEFAHDATFGYELSDLQEWARERIPSSWKTQQLPASIIRAGTEALAGYLTSVQPFTVVCVDIEENNDLALLADGQRRAEALGARFVTQSGPPYPRYVAGWEEAVPAQVQGRGPGLVVVGSHTQITTDQIDHAIDSHALHLVQLDVHAVLADPGAEVARCVGEGLSAMRARSVLLATTRTRIDGESALRSLELAGRVADAVVETTRGLLAGRPRFVIAKGGITSHDAVARSLGWQAARVIGPLVDQTLPVWESWSPHRDDPVVVIFPGNIGDRDLLTRALDRLEATLQPIDHSPAPNLKGTS